MSNHTTGGLRLPSHSLGNRYIALSSKGHFTGHVVLGDGAGVVVETESYLELSWCLCLIARPETASLVEQVAFEWYDRDGVWHTHYFDIYVKETDGSAMAYTVKPEARVSDDFWREMEQIAAQARASGFVRDVRLLSDQAIDKVELHNAQLLHGLRVRDPEADIAAEAVVRKMSGISTLASLSNCIGLEARGFRALIRLIRSHHLQLVQHEKIDPTTEVCKGKLI
jgi:hypothetical protein